MVKEIDYIETVCRTEKERLAGTSLDGHLNGILGVLPGLKARAAQLELDNSHLKFIRDDLIERKDRSELVGDNLRTLLGQHDAHWRAVADALGGVCCGGVDGPVSDPHSTAGVIVNEVARLKDTLAAVMADEWRDGGKELPKIDPDTCRSRDVLGCWPQGGMMVVYYDACNGWMDTEGGEPCVTFPTHWQPLPEAPVFMVRP